MNVAILGYGVVGTGVFELLSQDAELFTQKTGQPILVKKVLDLKEFPNNPVEQFLTHNPDDILTDESINLVVEVMGGLNPAYEYSKRALQAGKHVVTSNKELVSVHGPELLAEAVKHNCRYLFEASVGGGIPIIRCLKNTLLTEEITKITGILNGTTNYILSQMSCKNIEFSDMLKHAQEQGYAERDPSADLDGFDASRKLSILLSLCAGKHVNYSKIPTEGIANITSEDIACAKHTGNVIKLVAKAEIKHNTIEALVAPMLIDHETSVLAGVNDVFNAIILTASATDNNMYFGRGAGKLPTAGAIVGDMVQALLGEKETAVWNSEEAEILPVSEAVCERMVRVKAKKNFQPAVNEIFGQIPWQDAGIAGQYAFITPPMKDIEFREKIKLIERYVQNSIRIYAGR